MTNRAPTTSAVRRMESIGARGEVFVMGVRAVVVMAVSFVVMCVCLRVGWWWRLG